MKTCPSCKRDYEDSLRFCLEDGATLVRIDRSAEPTMTMPAESAFQPPQPPAPQTVVKPSLSTIRSLTNIFVAPAGVFASFRDVTMFGPAVVRFLAAVAIIVIAVVAYNVVYLVRIGSEQIVRASLEASPRTAELSPELKESAIQINQSPGLQALSLVLHFGQLILLLLVSMPLGALIYWLGGMLFKGTMNFMQALLVWTYAALPSTALWMLANSLLVLIRPPTSNMGIMNGSNGVVPANLGALFEVTTLPIPVYVVALGTLDLFAFYGLALAMIGLRKVSRISWLYSFAIVIFVWLIGVGWRIATAGVVAAILR